MTFDAGGMHQTRQHCEVQVAVTTRRVKWRKHRPTMPQPRERDGKLSSKLGGFQRAECWTGDKRCWVAPTRAIAGIYFTSAFTDVNWFEMFGFKRTRPCWVVLVSATEPATRKLIHECELENGVKGWRVKSGRKSYCAVWSDEPGSERTGEQQLAERASANGQASYILYCELDYAQVDVYEQGKYVGALQESPDQVAHELGASFPKMEQQLDASVDLTPHNANHQTADVGQLNMCGCTLRQWSAMMKTSLDWSVMIESVNTADIVNAESFLHAPDARSRLVACTLLSVFVGYTNDITATLKSKLEVLKATDSDELVRKAAARVLEDLPNK